MSGGVDSSVAAALLARQGHEVVGVTLDVWPHSDGQHLAERADACCALSSVEDARRVADKLGIAHYTLNFRDVFERTVIADFAAEYLRGRTPNPCIRCNEHVKFAALLARTTGLGAHCLATGHYACVARDPVTGRYLLYKGRDARKDQSYVLYVATQDLLARTVMPLGDLNKEQTRKLASDFGLATAHKAESQEICFVPDNDYGRFVREYAAGAEVPGPILDTDGRVLGRHRGIYNYTIGQRRGLGLGGPPARYVTAIDGERNAIVVGEERDLYHDALIADRVNLISLPVMDRPMRLAARIRYRAVETPALVVPLDGDRLMVRFDSPQRAITPGQAVVLYDGDLVVGGGTVAAVGSGQQELENAC